MLAQMHNDLALTEYIEPDISNFYNRPYLVPHSDRFVQALLGKVQSPVLKSIKRPIGTLTQFTDSTDIQCWPEALESISSVYQTVPVIYKGRNLLGLSFEEVFALAGNPRKTVSGK